MRMRIHEARQQRGVAEVDHLRISRNLRGSANAGNLSSHHNHQPRRDEGTCFSVKKPGRFQDHGILRQRASCEKKQTQ